MTARPPLSLDSVVAALAGVGATGVRALADRVQLRCLLPDHRDRSASAVVFPSGWYHCSRCGGRPARELVPALAPADRPLRIHEEPSGGPAEVWRAARVARLAAAAEAAGKPETVDLSAFERFGTDSPAYMTYDRGFSAETCAAWGVRHDRLRDRAILPICDWSGALLGWTGRSTVGREPKYLHSKGLRTSEVLFGAQLFPAGAVPLLCEGPLDAMRLWQRGFRFRAAPLAVLGCRVSAAQCERLTRRIGPGVPVVVVRDADTAGAELAKSLRKALDDLGDGRRVVEVTPSGKDIDGAPATDHAALRDILSRLLAGEKLPETIDLGATP